MECVYLIFRQIILQSLEYFIFKTSQHICQQYRQTSRTSRTPHTTAGDGEVLLGDVYYSPLPHSLEGLLGRSLASQLLLDDGLEEESLQVHDLTVCWMQMLNEPEAICRRPNLYYGGVADRDIIRWKNHSPHAIASLHVLFK
jgi:hypothetical protein